MFEFAISQHRKRLPGRLFWTSLVLSVAAHASAFGILIEFPWILGPGLGHWLRHPLTVVMRPNDQVEARQWRMVALLGTPGKMNQPSVETLKALVYDWEAASNAKAPPIRVKWGDESKAVADRAAARPVQGVEEPRPAPPPAPQVAQSAQPDRPDEAGAGGASRPTVYLPAPKPPTEPRQIPDKAAGARDTAPTSIPAGIKQPAATPAPGTEQASTQTPKPQPKVFEDEKAALRTEGTGLFDTRGFPLGEYANLIIERVKGNWYIPSNLRSSQGHTTVIFFITKDGRFSDARIVSSSGSQSLDIAALNAVIVSNPFPPLPKGFPGEQVGAKFVFSYNERP